MLSKPGIGRSAVRCIAFHEKAVKIGMRFGIGTVHSLLDCTVQSISASIEGVCWKTLQDVNRGSEQNPRPKILRKNLCVSFEVRIKSVVTALTH